jgi:sporulation protein YabP
MVQEQNRQQSGQKLTMENRKNVELNGVTEVISFDNNEIFLETVEGMMRFAGEDLHVKRLTLERGEVELEGKIQEISYHQSGREKTAGGVLSRLFR